MEWSIALSVPLGFVAILVIAIAPAMLDRGGAVETTPWAVRLASVWVVGLAMQAAITLALFSLGWPQSKRSRHAQSNSRQPPVSSIRTDGEHVETDADDDAPLHSVTVTIGGVWMAIPDLMFEGQYGDPSGPDATWRPNHIRHSVLESFSGASRVLMLWSMLLLTLGLGVMGCLLVDTATAEGTILAGNAATRVTGSQPSASVAAVDRPWIAAAWILCLQGFWQLMPLPQSLGRVGWSAAIGLFAQHPDAGTSDRVQAQYSVRIVRWWLVAWAVATLVIGALAIHASGISTQPGGRALPAFAGVTLLALWLFASTRGEDLFASQMTLAGNSETGVLKSRIGLRSTWQRWQASRNQREKTRRLIAAVQRERDEADDETRADEILQRLHADGPSSLSKQERQILSRVSEAIRRERAREDHNPHNH